MNPVFTEGKWIIAFYDGGSLNWWDRFTRPGFRHCFALRYLREIDAWVKVDWSNQGLHIEVLPKRCVDGVIVAVNKMDGRFLEIEVTEQPRRTVPLVPLYCVSAMKELVGLRNWKVITPYQLYCALRKEGASRMFDIGHIKEITDGEPV